MARGRNAPALFDVIHAAKRPPKASPTGGGVPTPKHWFKGKPAAEQADAAHAGDPATPPAEVPTGTRRSWLAAARQQAAAPSPAVEGSAEQDDVADERFDGAADGPADDGEPDRRGSAGGSHVVITRMYPPEVTERPAEAGAGDDYAEEDTAELPPLPLTPLAAANEHAATPAADDEKPSWSERRARVLAERASSGSSVDPSFDPTADVSPADLRAARRPAKSAAVDDEPPARPRRTSAGPRPSATRPAVDPPVAVDHDAGEVRFRLSYVGAALAGVILLLVLAIAYLAGQRAGTAESAVDARGTGRPAVAHAPGTDVTHLMAAATSPAPAAPPSVEAAAADGVPAPTGPVAGPAAPVVAPPPAEPVARQPGMLYVVMLSYPDRETAARAAAFLNHNGIACDVVNGPAGYAMRAWSSVVGLDPIAPRDAHAPAVLDRLRAVTALGPKFSPKVYNQFAPQLYAWKADSDTPRP